MLGREQGPWKRLRPKVGTEPCRLCPTVQYSLCLAHRLSLVPGSLGHRHTHCIVWGFQPAAWMDETGRTSVPESALSGP